MTGFNENTIIIFMWPLNLRIVSVPHICPIHILPK